MSIYFLSSVSDSFPYEEAQKLYEELKPLFMPDSALSYQDFILKYSPYIFAGFYKDQFKGIIYLHWFEDNICFLSGFAKRKEHIHVIEAIKLLSSHIMETYNLKAIFSKPSNNAALFCELRAGFRHIKDNVYVLNKGDI